MPLRSSYLICSSPRSGSYLLCELLRDTGVAGNPTEYVSQNFERHWSARWHAKTYSEFLDRIVTAGMTSNGVFGVKLHYYQLRYFLARLRAMPGREMLEAPQLLDTVFPDRKYIWIIRRDRIRQAVSYVRATQSNVWWLTDRPPAPCGAPTGRELRFSFRDLDRAVQRMDREEAGWRIFFERHAIAPLVIEYEELAADPHAALNRTLEFLQLSPAGVVPAAPGMKRQADQRSEEWADRYRRLKMAQRQRTVPAFRDIHRDESIVVCGCGGSLKDFDRPEQAITIGVNDVGRRFHPNYLLVLDARNKFPEERFKAIESSESDFLFTDQQLGIPHADIVKVILRHRQRPDLDDAHPLHYLARPWYTPYVATTLAAYMGAAYIGLIGVDFTDDHFFGATGPYSGARHVPIVDDHFRRLNVALIARGTKMFNLSGISRITAFPRLSLDEFRALRQRPAARFDARRPMRVVVYSSASSDPFADALATFINCETIHYARSVRSGTGARPPADLDASRSPEMAAAELSDADVVVVHNGIVDPSHQHLIRGKAVVTVIDGSATGVSWDYVRDGYPVGVLSHAMDCREWRDRPVLAMPVRLGATRSRRDEPLAIYHVSDARTLRRRDSDLRPLERLAHDANVPLRVVDAADSWADSIAVGDVVVDATGSCYGYTSLIALAAGAVAINAMAARGELTTAFRRCAAGERSQPFVFAHHDRVDCALKPLLRAGRDVLEAEGAAGRRWLERHWRFEWQWDQLWLPLIGEALRQTVRRQSPVTDRWLVTARPKTI